MSFPLVQRRPVWWPTLAGWCCLIVTICAALALWWFEAESFFSSTARKPADVLVVEGWIGVEGVLAAKAEFERGGYHYIVASGGLRHDRWDQHHLNYAELAAGELLRLGLPSEKIIVTRQNDTEAHRTFVSALAARAALQAAGIEPKGVNVFTLGPHARRSRLIFAKVFQPKTPVGVVSWIPPEYAAESWWHSSERAEDLIKETVGWPYEAVLNSGRAANSANEAAGPKP